MAPAATKEQPLLHGSALLLAAFALALSNFLSLIHI